ncbi:MAG TPA: YceI family protein [Candidatus Acidoferrum sp.]|nr:YceI family protein [Candidatus Acidoferrum sp.]
MLHIALATLLAIDPVKSKVEFSVQHIFVEHVVGTVPVISGSVDLPAGTLVPTSVTAVLDPTKMKTGEVDRDGVMQTPDWFDTKKFPTWTFTSTKITATATGFTMDGDLTMHGVTQPEHLVVIASGDPLHPVYHATCQIDRHAFGMATTRLDPVIGGTVDVTLDIRVR